MRTIYLQGPCNTFASVPRMTSPKELIASQVARRKNVSDPLGIGGLATPRSKAVPPSERVVSAVVSTIGL